ncbi:hypothetical protein ACFQ0M_06580 [Kitasatospora aburaviensis]
MEALNLVAVLSTFATVAGRTAAGHLFPGLDDRPRRPAALRVRLLTTVLAAGLAGAGMIVPGGGGLAIVVGLTLPTCSGVLLTRRAEYDTATKPGVLLADERRIALTEAVLVAPAVAAAWVGFFSWPRSHPLLAVGALVVAWSCSSFTFAATGRWGRWTATRLELAARRRLPWDVMTFLEDARRLGMLRQVGGVYQFRHTELRRRLGGAGEKRPTAGTLPPRTVLVRSSGNTVRALGRGVLGLTVPVVALLVVVSPLTSRDGYLADWQQSWELLVRLRFQLGAMGAVLLLGAVALRAVDTKLRIDAEAIELTKGRKVRLRWDDVDAVRVHRVRGTVLPAHFHLELKPAPGRDTPRSLTKCGDWIRFWDLGPTDTPPLELEAALAHFAGRRWKSTTGP